MSNVYKHTSSVECKKKWVVKQNEHYKIKILNDR